jgi:hypothetical protein
MDTCATTILAQLGGNKFLAMTGAKNLVYGENSLTLKIGRGARNGITHLCVTLDADDTYTVQFHRVRGVKVALVEEISGVYADSLQELFTDRTGFATRL